MVDRIDPFEDDVESDEEIRYVQEGSNDIRWEHSSKKINPDKKDDE